MENHQSPQKSQKTLHFFKNQFQKLKAKSRQLHFGPSIHSFFCSFGFVLVQLFVGPALAGSWTSQNLKPGQCISDPNSKNYLRVLKSPQSSHYQKTIESIGAKKIKELRDSPQESFYFCSVTCRNQNQEDSQIWVLHSDSPLRSQSMDGFLCHGVHIESVNIVGSIFSPQPVVSPFYAYETRLPELHFWLEAQNFKIEPDQFKKLQKDFRETLREVSVSYLNTNNAAFVQAGSVLWDIAEDNEQGRLALAERLRIIEANQWRLPLEFKGANDWIDMLIIFNGHFLAYE